MNLESYQKVDRNLVELGKQIKMPNYVAPIDQQERFLEEGKEPDWFLFANPVDFDTKQAGEQLARLEEKIPDDDLGHFLGQRRKHLLLENRIIEHRRDPEVVTQSLIELFGRPDESLVDEARKTLETTVPTDFEKPHSAQYLAEALRDTLDQYGLTSWTIELNRTHWPTAVQTNLRNVRIHENKTFSDNDILRLGVHEIGVHALRGENGHQQPITAPFNAGYIGYPSTEEGLATHAEKVAGVDTSGQQREYAARVLAVSSMLDGESFHSIHSMLMDYGYSPEAAFRLGERVFKARGFPKDHIYLEGNRAINEHLKNGGIITPLYVGKIPLADYNRAQTLVEKGVLKPPQLVPDFFKGH